MKILSTPTASTKNGMTSITISVKGTPKKLKMPREQATELSTIKIPAMPKEIFESTYKKEKQITILIELKTYPFLYIHFANVNLAQYTIVPTQLKSQKCI